MRKILSFHTMRVKHSREGLYSTHIYCSSHYYKKFLKLFLFLQLILFQPILFFNFFIIIIMVNNYCKYYNFTMKNAFFSQRKKSLD